MTRSLALRSAGGTSIPIGLAGMDQHPHHSEIFPSSNRILVRLQLPEHADLLQFCWSRSAAAERGGITSANCLARRTRGWGEIS